MRKKKAVKTSDVNVLAASIVKAATEEPEPTNEPTPKLTGRSENEFKNVPPEKNPAAVALGRLGGLKGGKARAAKLTPKQRKQIAQKAAQARWGKI